MKHHEGSNRCRLGIDARRPIRTARFATLTATNIKAYVGNTMHKIPGSVGRRDASSDYFWLRACVSVHARDLVQSKRYCNVLSEIPDLPGIDCSVELAVCSYKNPCDLGKFCGFAT